MDLQHGFGVTVQQIRKVQGLSQEQLAFHANIDRRYMSDIENGKRNISLDIMERISKCLNISISELMRRAEEISKPEYTTKDLKRWLCYYEYEDSIVLEGVECAPAAIGVSEDGRVIYSYDIMVEKLMHIEGMSYAEAMEYVDYNTIRSLPYMGKMAPIILYSINKEKF